MEDMKDLRKEIDTIDDQMLSLFQKRMALAEQVADAKMQAGLPILDRTRQRDILFRMTEGQDDQMATYTKVLFSTLFDLSRSCQQAKLQRPDSLAATLRKASENGEAAAFPLRATVACQGREGAYSQIACDRLFSTPKIMYFNHFDGVVRAVRDGLCDYGVLPIENSLHGSVGQVYDLMEKYRFFVVRGLRLQVDHALVAKPGAKLSDIRTIYSHEQAIGQCAAFLAAHPNVEAVPVENTAIAAKMVADHPDHTVAAIASADCAQLYALEQLVEGVQDNDTNFTRFVCISRKMEVYPGANRISLVCTLPHRPGALYSLIARFSALGLNLVKLESRPIPGKNFEFRFYMDLEAQVGSPAVGMLLDQLEQSDIPTLFLGAYAEQ